MAGSLRYTVLDSPLGPLSACCDADGALVCLGFDAPPPAGARRDDEPFASLAGAVARYFRREPVDFREIPVAPTGSPFQHTVWSALREIPHGSTCSYGDVARRIGSNPRTVGQANGQNPIAIVVPCHRVVGATGALVGYAGGIERKRALLVLEGSRLL